nr:MAG TPA: hypothetical protein [Caudoviricetes sp.]
MSFTSCRAASASNVLAAISTDETATRSAAHKIRSPRSKIFNAFIVNHSFSYPFRLASYPFR